MSFRYYAQQVTHGPFFNCMRFVVALDEYAISVDTTIHRKNGFDNTADVANDVIFFNVLSEKCGTEFFLANVIKHDGRAISAPADSLSNYKDLIRLLSEFRYNRR